jgi:hypothetical protein
LRWFSNSGFRRCLGHIALDDFLRLFLILNHSEQGLARLLCCRQQGLRQPLGVSQGSDAFLFGQVGRHQAEQRRHVGHVQRTDRDLYRHWRGVASLAIRSSYWRR